MELYSFIYLLFLPPAVLLTRLLPAKFRYIIILAANIIFFIQLSPVGLGVLGLVMLATWIGGLVIGKGAETRPHGQDDSDSTDGRESTDLLRNGPGKAGSIVAAVTTVCVIALIILGRMGIQIPAAGGNMIIQTAGLSFYGLACLSYVYDCAGGRMQPVKNPLLYAAFASFFPVVTAGPIERGKNLIPQLKAPASCTFQDIREAVFTIIYGYVLKLVIADRLGVMVDTFYKNPSKYRGTMALIMAALYLIQLYCDFTGYTCIATGSAKLLGIKLSDNFRGPLLSQSVSEYWRRWHISLSSWLRDYIYIPLGGNRKGKLRKYLNIMITFAVSGLWHGQGLTFLIWGLVNGLYQVLASVLQPVRDLVVKVCHIRREAFSHRVFKTLFTFFIMNMVFVLFRSPDLATAWEIYSHLGVVRLFALFDGSLYTMGLTRPEVLLTFALLCMVAGVDLCERRGICVHEKLAQQGVWLRYAVALAGILLVAVCGMWGRGYDQASFIYAQF